MTKKAIVGVYKITSPSGKFYIGSSVNVAARWNGHKAELRKGNHHCKPLQRAAIKYGIESLSMEIVEECEIDNVRNLEQAYIDSLCPNYNSSKCVNEPLTDLWKDDEFRRKGIERTKKQASEWRKSPEWVKKQKLAAGLALSKLHKNPEFKKEHVKRATTRLQLLVNSNKDIKKKASEARKKRLDMDRKDPEVWAKRNAKIRELISTPVLCVETGVIFESQRKAGEWLKKTYGFKSVGHISNAISGRINKAYGFSWRLA